MRVAIAILVATLAGCATEPPKFGLLLWDFEANEIAQKRWRATERATEKLYGLVEEIMPGRMLQDGIELTPPELVTLITDTLSPSLPRTAQEAHSLSQTTREAPKNIWTIADSNEGQLTTDWRSIPGRKSGVLWWERTYETEVRHVITIRRSYRSPDLTNFSIATEVRERPNSNYPWVETNSELGRASFEQLKNMLLLTIRMHIDTRKYKK